MISTHLVYAHKSKFPKSKSKFLNIQWPCEDYDDVTSHTSSSAQTRFYETFRGLQHHFDDLSACFPISYEYSIMCSRFHGIYPNF